MAQAVGNTVKRVVILIATAIAFGTPMTPVGIAGARIPHDTQHHQASLGSAAPSWLRPSICRRPVLASGCAPLHMTRAF